jgi:hypothetical protein
MEGPYCLCFLLLGAELGSLCMMFVKTHNCWRARLGKDTLGTQFSMFFSLLKVSMYAYNLLELSTGVFII